MLPCSHYSQSLIPHPKHECPHPNQDEPELEGQRARLHTSLPYWCVHARVQIKLSTKSFGRDAAEVAAAGVRNCAASLAHADLSDVIAGRPEAEALEALRIMCDALAHVQLRWVGTGRHIAYFFPLFFGTGSWAKLSQWPRCI